jgi:hypothetical protein
MRISCGGMVSIEEYHWIGDDRYVGISRCGPVKKQPGFAFLQAVDGGHWADGQAAGIIAVHAIEGHMFWKRVAGT